MGSLTRNNAGAIIRCCLSSPHKAWQYGFGDILCMKTHACGTHTHTHTQKHKQRHSHAYTHTHTYTLFYHIVTYIMLYAVITKKGDFQAQVLSQSFAYQIVWFWLTTRHEECTYQNEGQGTFYFSKHEVYKTDLNAFSGTAQLPKQKAKLKYSFSNIDNRSRVSVVFVWNFLTECYYQYHDWTIVQCLLLTELLWW